MRRLRLLDLDAGNLVHMPRTKVAEVALLFLLLRGRLVSLMARDDSADLVVMRRGRLTARSVTNDARLRERGAAGQMEVRKSHRAGSRSTTRS